jgi:histone-lysine N-methyltransferase SETMAR
MKVTLITFFDIRGVVHFEFIPQGRTFNQAYYVVVLERLHEAVYRTRHELGLTFGWILHHGNAPVQKRLSVKRLLAKKSITEMENPPYSPYLAPNDFWLFAEINSPLKGRIFQNTENFQITR